MRKKWKLVVAGILLGTMLTACTDASDVPATGGAISGEPIVIDEPTITPPPSSEDANPSTESSEAETKPQKTTPPDKENC